VKPIDNDKGQYMFLPGIAPYSSGVVAMPGYEIVHATLRRPLPYGQGFDLIDRRLQAEGRPRYALCAIELRSPQPFSFDGFAEFNQGYRQILSDWDLLLAGQNPIARTNVAPAVNPPAEPSLYAFSYTVPRSGTDTFPTFVVAGAGDISGTLSAGNIIRAGETSAEAIAEKAAHVMNIMQQRLNGLYAGWADVTAIDIYTIHPLQTFLVPAILDKIGPAAGHGVRWFYSRPPILGLEFEMDLRGVSREIWL
jgi:hypothetical protein